VVHIPLYQIRQHLSNDDCHKGQIIRTVLSVLCTMTVHQGGHQLDRSGKARNAEVIREKSRKSVLARACGLLPRVM